MPKHDDNTFRNVVTGGLRKQHTAGIAQGAYAMCSVILGKAQNEEKAPEERIEDIIKFCTVCIKFKGKPEI